MLSFPLNASTISAQLFQRQQHCFRHLTGVTRSIIIDKINNKYTNRRWTHRHHFEITTNYRSEMKDSRNHLFGVGSTVVTNGRSSSTGIYHVIRSGPGLRMISKAAPHVLYSRRVLPGSLPAAGWRFEYPMLYNSYKYNSYTPDSRE